MYAYDRAKQALMLETDRPIALREAIMACRNGGTVSVIGVYGGFIDKFPMGSVMNRSLTIKTGQCHVQRYMKPLLERIQKGEIDPSFGSVSKLAKIVRFFGAAPCPRRGGGRSPDAPPSSPDSQTTRRGRRDQPCPSVPTSTRS